MKQYWNLAIWIVGITLAGCGSITPPPAAAAKPRVSALSTTSVSGSVGTPLNVYDSNGAAYAYRYGPSLITTMTVLWTCGRAPRVQALSGMSSDTSAPRTGVAPGARKASRHNPLRDLETCTPTATLACSKRMVIIT